MELKNFHLKPVLQEFCEHDNEVGLLIQQGN